MKDIYSSDKPITNHQGDRFQRYFFSKRIAETILKRESPDGLVIGLYGAWGEGKSTILNFLEGELSGDSIVVVRFNPWSFSYEDNILTNFYHTLATAFEQKLSSTKERLGKIFGEYGSLGSLGGIDLTKFGESLSKVEPNQLKERINKFIKESGKKLVIIIDDIDRLDKTEIFSLIKLVKVNADFTKTYYVLSFDNDMVASAISERFGDGTKQSGEHFLEKIVQVPLIIPKAQVSDLRSFALTQVEDVLNFNKIELSQNEIQSLIKHFDAAILPRIDTPRSALRYSNSISFTFPLLLNEVNYIDLLLIEAVKIFYPDLYNFIRSKSHILLDSYENSYSRNINREEIKAQFITELKDNANITVSELPNILSLLTFLFPRLNELLNNSFRMQFNENVILEKKIGSAHYFKRYFAYAVLKGEISDVEFENFSKNLSVTEQKQIANQLLEFRNSASTDTLISKLRAAESKLDDVSAIKLVKALTFFANDLPTEKTDFISSFLSNSKVQISYMIKRILSNFKKEKITEVYQELISVSNDYEFSFELFRVLYSQESEEALIDEKDRMGLLTIIRKKMLEESGSDPIFVRFKNFMGNIFAQWYEQNEIEYQKYIKSTVIDLNSLRLFIKSISPTITSSTRPEPYKGSINKSSYEWLSTFVDLEYIYNLIKKFNSEIEDFENVFGDELEIPSDDQRLRQFEHWYLLEN